MHPPGKSWNGWYGGSGTYYYDYFLANLKYHHRVHEFNIEDTLALFLPYHDSPHFEKMVTILHIKFVTYTRLSCSL